LVQTAENAVHLSYHFQIQGGTDPESWAKVEGSARRSIQLMGSGSGDGVMAGMPLIRPSDLSTTLYIPTMFNKTADVNILNPHDEAVQATFTLYDQIKGSQTKSILLEPHSQYSGQVGVNTGNIDLTGLDHFSAGVLVIEADNTLAASLMHTEENHASLVRALNHNDLGPNLVLRDWYARDGQKSIETFYNLTNLGNEPVTLFISTISTDGQQFTNTIELEPMETSFRAGTLFGSTADRVMAIDASAADAKIMGVVEYVFQAEEGSPLKSGMRIIPPVFSPARGGNQK